MQKRDPVLDIARGIGIVLIVAGHSGAPGDKYIYLFHVSIFFILSGWFYHQKYSSDFHSMVRFLWGKIKRLWLPFVAANTVFTIMNNLFLQINVLTSDSRIAELPGNIVSDKVSLKDIVGRTLHWCVFDGGTQLGGAMWFLQVLFQISVLYVGIDFLLRRCFTEKTVDVLQGLVSLVLLITGFTCQQLDWNAWQLATACSSYIFFYIGHVLHRYKLFQSTGRKGVACGVLSFLILALAVQIGNVDLANNSYRDPVFLVCCALAGWELIWQVAVFLSRLAPAKRLMSFLGKNTMPILILHFLAFKVVTWCGIQAFGMESYLLAALGDDEVCLAFARLDKLLVHGLDGCEVLAHHAVQSAAAGFDVADDATQNADVGVGVHKDLDVHQVAELLGCKNQDALHNNDGSRINGDRLVAAVVDGVIVDGNFYALPGA